MFPTGAQMPYTSKSILSHTYALKCMIHFRTSRSAPLPPPKPPFIMPSPPVEAPLDLLAEPIPIGDGNPTRGARALAGTEARDPRAAAQILSRMGRALSDLEARNARVLKRIERCFLARTGSLRGGDPQASPPGAGPLGARPGAGATG